jgi:hypothetical protein
MQFSQSLAEQTQALSNKHLLIMYHYNLYFPLVVAIKFAEKQISNFWFFIPIHASIFEPQNQ